MKRFSIFLSLGVLLAVGSAREAQATLLLSIDPGTAVGNAALIRVADNTAANVNVGGFVTTHADTSGVLGFVSYIGSVGAFVVTVNSGTSTPLIDNARIDLFAIDVSSGAGVLTTAITNVFSTPPPINFLTMDFGGTTDGSIELTGYAGAAAFDMTHSTATAVVGPGPFGGTVTSSPFTAVDPSSMTIIAFVTHTGAGQVSSFDADLFVPEPSMMVIFGSLIGLGCVFGIRRRNREV